MAVNYSTGLTHNLLAAVSTAFTNCVIDIYSGTQPLTADDAETGTLLARTTLDGGAFVEGAAANGLNFAPPTNGTLEKDATENWKYTGLADGTARWFRLRANDVDTGGQSTQNVRLDGSVGTISGDMRLSSINIKTGAPGTIDVFTIRRKVS